MRNTAPHTQASCSSVLLFATFLLLCATFATFCYFCLLFANVCSQTRLKEPNPSPHVLDRGWQHSTPGAGAVATKNTAPCTRASCRSVLLCATFATTFATFAYFLPMPAAKTHPPAANVQPRCTRSALEHAWYVGVWPCEMQPPLSGLLAALCCFVQLFATSVFVFCYFLLLFANARSQTHLLAANLRTRRTRAQCP